MDSSSLEIRLQENLAAYLQELQAGRAPDRSEWLARHPDLADELRSFFADHDKMTQAAAPVRAALGDDPTTPAESFPQSFGDYELLKEIGRGGMGVVYKASQISLHRIVAVKRIRAGQLASSEEMARFRREAEAAAGLDHPHIVPILEVGEHQGQHFFTMKLIEGGNLGGHLAKFADARACAELMIKIARAVHHAHQRGILHRDLKPGNILVDADGNPHVSDFGLAQPFEKETKLTQSGAIVGTAEYMAPEQARGEKGLTTAADVYGLGAILYVLLTGRPPFQGDYNWDTLKKVVEEEPVSPRSLNRKVNRDLEAICLHCLEKQAAKRYGSADLLAEDLQNWLDGKPIIPRPAGLARRVVKWVRRHPAWAALIALSVALVLSSVVFSWRLQVEIETVQNTQSELIAEKQNVAQTRNDLDKESAELKDKSTKLADELWRSRQIAYTAQLQRATGVYKSDPKQALDLLHDYKACPIDARDAPWRFLEQACQRRLKSTAIGMEGGWGHAPVPTANGRFCTLVQLAKGNKTAVMDIRSGDILGEHDLPLSMLISADGTTACEYLERDMGPAPVEMNLLVKDLTAGKSWKVKLMDSGRRQYEKENRYRFDMVMSPNGKLLADTAHPGLWLYSLDSGKLVTKILAGDNAVVVASAFSPDSRYLAVAVNGQFEKHGKGVLVVSTETGRELCFVPSESPSGRPRLFFSHDGRTLAYLNSYRVSLNSNFEMVEMTLCEVPTGQIRNATTLQSISSIASGAFSRDDTRFAFCSLNPHRNGYLYVCDVHGAKKVRSFRAQQESHFTPLAFSPDGARLILCYDNAVELLDIVSGNSQVVPTPSRARWASLVAENRLLVSTDTGLRSWHIDLPSYLTSFQAPGSGRALGERQDGNDNNRGNGVYWSPDGRHVGLFVRPELRVVDALTGMEKCGVSDCDQYPVFLADGKQIAFAGIRQFPNQPAKWQLWSVDTGLKLDWPAKLDFIDLSRKWRELYDERWDKTKWVGQSHLSPDRRTFPRYGQGNGRTLELVDQATGQARTALSTEGRQTIDGRFNRDGSLLATWDDAGLVRIWDLRPPLEYARFPGTSANWAPDGSSLAVSDHDRSELNLVDMITGQRLATASTTLDESGRLLIYKHFPFDSDRRESVESFSALPSFLRGWGHPGDKSSKGWFLYSSDRKVRVQLEWKLTTVTNLAGDKVRAKLPVDFDGWSLDIHQAWLATISPDGAWLACPNSDHLVRIVNLSAGGKTTTINIRRPNCLAFSPDNTILAVASEIGLQFLAPATGEIIKHFIKDSACTSVAFSADGKSLATGHLGGVRVWDAASGKMLGSLPPQSREVRSLAFSPDGRLLAAGVNREIIVWDLARWRAKLGGAP